MIRTLSSLMLQDYGYEVLEAGSFEDAREMFGRWGVDLILCDSLSPGMDTAELMKKGKNNWECPFPGDVPVIMMAVKSCNGVFNKGVKCDAGSILFKPFSKNQLLEAVRNNIYQ